MRQTFSTNYETILQGVERIDPLMYGRTRNHVNGAVTYLSPYISRGVISTKQVLQSVLDRGYSIKSIEPLVKELCWRDYFQRVAQHKDVWQDIKQPQTPVLNNQIPVAVVQAKTGIQGIDEAVQTLYETGYMHNHCRMYTASLVCNLAMSHWRNPARWMYYHLLDGDWASNACSWQWVSGANSGKKYYANQENINRYTNTQQANTFLDVDYDTLMQQSTPPATLLATEDLSLTVVLPKVDSINIDKALPTFIYNYYNLDPLWHKEVLANRVLLLDPDFFAKYPVSQKCVDFMLSLAQNIEGIQVYIGSFQSLQLNEDSTHFKEHPLNVGYNGIEEPRDWIVEEVEGYFPSFFAYWKNIEKHIYKNYYTK